MFSSHPGPPEQAGEKSNDGAAYPTQSQPGQPQPPPPAPGGGE